MREKYHILEAGRLAHFINKRTDEVKRYELKREHYHPGYFVRIADQWFMGRLRFSKTCFHK